jgi:hypothetical protein
MARELKERQFGVLNWHGDKMSIATSVVWHSDRWISPSMQAFLDVVAAKQEQAGTPTLVRQRAS